MMHSNNLEKLTGDIETPCDLLVGLLGNPLFNLQLISFLCIIINQNFQAFNK